MNGAIARSAAAVGSGPRVLPARIVYDDRYAEGRRFAAVMAMRGAVTRALDAGDVTRFWYEELDGLWRREPVAIAGLTQFGPMFVVECLAAERHLRSALRVEHRVDRDGTLAHAVTGPRATLTLLEGIDGQQLDWPELMAALVARAGGDFSVEMSFTVRTPGAAPALAPGAAPDSAEPSFIHYYTPHAVQQGYGPARDGPLYSWLVAPRRA